MGTEKLHQVSMVRYPSHSMGQSILSAVLLWSYCATHQHTVSRKLTENVQTDFCYKGKSIASAKSSPGPFI